MPRDERAGQVYCSAAHGHHLRLKCCSEQAGRLLVYTSLRTIQSTHFAMLFDVGLT